jgi:rRNA maturation endonuclease Nob1
MDRYICYNCKEELSGWSNNEYCPTCGSKLVKQKDVNFLFDEMSKIVKSKFHTIATDSVENRFKE